MEQLLNFGQAIEAAKSGKKVARKGWNGQNMFAYVVPEADCEMYDIENEIFGKNETFIVSAHWRIKTAQGSVCTWSPSGSDSLAEDWQIVD